MKASPELYRDRALTKGFPNLEQVGVAWFSEHQRVENLSEGKVQLSNLRSVVNCLSRLVDLSAGENTICEIGCGPNPYTLEELRQLGFKAVGIEPIKNYVEAARIKLGDPQAVLQGTAENIPLKDESQRFVILESVIEHVESPRQALTEVYRVLVPGGVAYIYTTNRHHISLRGRNGEFRVPFYNWFPALVKESYVFKQLHYEPELANFTPRPAVHWFSYTDLCKIGRDAGFAHFYSPVDLADASDTFLQRGALRPHLIGLIRRSPWLRSLALLQFGGAIFMWKRS